MNLNDVDVVQSNCYTHIELPTTLCLSKQPCDNLVVL